MTAHITLDPPLEQVELTAGGVGELLFTITNAGQVVDAFDIRVHGLAPAFYTLAPERLSLFPQTMGMATLQLHPPAELNVLADDYPFELMVTSQNDPNDAATLPLTLRLAAVGKLALDIEPRRLVARHGTFTLLLTNSANIERAVELRPSDPDELLLFSFGAPVVVSQVVDVQATSSSDIPQGVAPAPYDAAPKTSWVPPGSEATQGYLELTVPPANKVEVPLDVRTKRRIWTGLDTTLKFEVVGAPGSPMPGVEPEEGQLGPVAGELVYKPYLTRWSALPIALRRAVAIGVPVLAVALALFLITRPSGDAPPNANAVAAANATRTAEAAEAAFAAQTAEANARATQTAVAADASASAAAAAASQTAQAEAAASQTAQAAAAASPTTRTEAAASPTVLTQQLEIVRFDFEPSADGHLQVAWEVTHALTVTLNTRIVGLIGSEPLDTEKDQAITLWATDGKEEVSQNKGVLLMRSPEIVTFSVQPEETCPGCEVSLVWNTVRAEKVLLGEQQIEPNGCIKVKADATSEYVLTATNAFGEVGSVSTLLITEGLPTPAPGLPCQ